MIRREDRRAVLAENLPPGLLDNPWRYPVALQLLAIVAKLLAEQCADETGLACNLAALWKVVQLINDIASAQAT